MCYDVREARHPRRVHKVLKGFGAAWQYSVFFCALEDIDRVRLQVEIEAEVNIHEDQIIILDLGGDERAVYKAAAKLGPGAPRESSTLEII